MTEVQLIYILVLFAVLSVIGFVTILYRIEKEPEDLVNVEWGKPEKEGEMPPILGVKPFTEDELEIRDVTIDCIKGMTERVVRVLAIIWLVAVLVVLIVG